ncbi:hypothetical protein NDA13_001667 [Ustilago tritici]|nr:hypothetical protein NDA13_001667 [Ustilago tritici]
MLPTRSNDTCCLASNPGSVSVLADWQTHAADASTASTTRQIQTNGAPTTLTSNQEDTNNPTPIPLTEHHEDVGDEAMEDPCLVEADQWAFQPIFTGRLVWSAKHSAKPIVPFEELPLPRSDRTRAQQHMQAKGVKTPDCVVNFPCGTGQNRFVEITVPSNQLVTLSEVSLVFNRTSLQCILVGPALPCNSLTLKILNIPQANAPTATAHYVAQPLKAYVQVHNVWIHQVSYHNNPTPPANTNIFIALISTPAGDEGDLDPV